MRKKESIESKLARLLGIELTEDDINREQIAINRARNGEAALAFYDAPDLFKMVNCKMCGNVFAVNRNNISLCSAECLARALKQSGLKVNVYANRDEKWVERTYFFRTEPLVVAPELLSLIIEDYQRLLSHSEAIAQESAAKDWTEPIEGEIQGRPEVGGNDERFDDYE